MDVDHGLGTPSPQELASGSEAFAGLLAAWNHWQDLRAADAPFPQRIAAIEALDRARDVLIAHRRACSGDGVHHRHLGPAPQERAARPLDRAEPLAD